MVNSYHIDLKNIWVWNSWGHIFEVTFGLWITFDTIIFKCDGSSVVKHPYLDQMVRSSNPGNNIFLFFVVFFLFLFFSFFVSFSFALLSFCLISENILLKLYAFCPILDISIPSGTILSHLGPFCPTWDCSVPSGTTLCHMGIINQQICLYDVPLIVRNYWTNLNETLHVGWDCLPSCFRKSFRLISCPTCLLGP